MRVLVDVSAVPDEPRGAGVYVIALVRGLAGRRDVDLALLARTGDAGRWQAWAPDADVQAVVPAHRPGRLLWEQRRGARAARDLGADVYHGPHYTLPLRLRVPGVVTIHDLTFFDRPETHERAKVAFFRRMIPASARRAAVCVCVSQATADRLGVIVPTHGDVVVVHHGIDHERFRPTGDEAEDLARLRAHGVAPPYVAFVGTIEPRKDIPTLVAAFARVVAERPDLHLVLAGGAGWGAREARAAIAKHDVADRVVWTGYLPDDAVAPLLRRAAVVAYPSLDEGFGFTALEALACGTPLVSSIDTAVQEVVGDAAVLVPAGVPDALADGIELALDPPTAQRLRLAGPARAATFTWDACIAGHVAAYERALALAR